MSSKDPVRTLVLPLQGATAILPQAAIVEIVSFSETEAVEAPQGEVEVIGMINWHEFNVPVIALESLLDSTSGKPGAKAKVAICNALDNSLQHPAIGIVLESVPRVLVVEDGRRLPAAQEKSDFALSSRHQGDLVWIPDLEKIGCLVNEQLA
jgi:chemotaxis signal transduction protein